MAESLRSLTSILSIVLFTGLIACNKSKNTGIDAAGVAAIQASSDAAVAGSDGDSKTIEECEKSASDDDTKAEAEDYDEDLELKSDKAKGDKDKKCPVSTTDATIPAAKAPAPSGTASLADGQKLYASNCQGCHGALPGEKQGATAATILAASTVGPHKGITPWPAGAGSTLSAQDAAASLAAAMK